MSKKKNQQGFASFPFDEFAELISVNPSESMKMMRKIAKEHKLNQTKTKK